MCHSSKITATFISLALLAGCATGPTGANYRPIVDLKNNSSSQFEIDLHECQNYAAQAAGAAEKAAGGAVAGALFGALLAAAAGSNYNRGQNAKVGAVMGMAGGAVEGEHDQRSIINRCLSGRGYHVLK